MEHLNHRNCPVCDAVENELFLTIPDHMITKEVFKVVRCSACGFHFTNPIPQESEIGRYYKSDEYISHSSNNSGIVNKAYNVVRNITLKRKLKLITRLSNGKELLDVGAGTGHFLSVCKTAGWNVQGLEPDEDARDFAKQNFDINLDPLSDLFEVKDNSKDVITMWHVLEHVYHLKRDVAELVRILKPDGVLIIAVPNMSSKDAQNYKEMWAAYDVPRHLYHFQKETIFNLMSQFDLECKEVLPMKFDSYYVSMLSEKYKNGNIVSGVLNGLKSNLAAKKGGFSSQIYIFKKK